jgi:thiol-disulfide isomerase/thioredoxin
MKAILLTTLSLCSLAFAADKPAAVPDAKLADFKIGALVSGPAVDLSKTGGKAVVIEAWGVNCGPCIASLPHIEQLAKRNKSDTIVIGAESQNSPTEKINDIVKKNKLSYSITSGGVQGPVSFSGIPHAFVFDTTGKLIFHGNPFDKEFEKSVRRAGKPAPATSTGLLKK